MEKEQMNIKEQKISKGYRLKRETHELIKELKQICMGELDFAISAACRKFLKEIKSKKRKT